MEVTESVDIEPDRIYVISPRSQLEISGSRLTVEELPPERPRMPVDRFFRSLAEERGANASAVVLSGTGRDGTLGLRAIRENGGITAAQDPEDADYPEMPRSAISEGCAEVVRPASELVEEVLRVIGEKGLEEAEPDELPEETQSALERILARVGSEAGHQEHQAKIEELDEVNSYLSNLMEATDIATIFLDRELRVRRFTESATDIFNLLPSDEGRPFHHITHHLELEDYFEERIRGVLETLETAEREVWDREGRCYIMRIRPYRSPEDRIGGVVITCFEITDRKRMEEEVRSARDEAEAERSRLAALMDHLPAGVVIVEAASEAVLSVNQRARELLWREGDNGDGERRADDPVQLDLPETGSLLVERAVEFGEPVLERELTIDLAQGRRDLLVSAAPITDGRGEIRECVLTLVDIEEVVRQAREKEEEAERARGCFVATVSHEFRTPLNAILGYTQLLSEGIPDALAKEQSRTVHRIEACVPGPDLRALLAGA